MAGQHKTSVHATFEQKTTKKQKQKQKQKKKQPWGRDKTWIDLLTSNGNNFYTNWTRPTSFIHISKQLEWNVLSQNIQC